MQLKQIDKDRYRSHFNVVIVFAVAVFSALGVGFSALLIRFFGEAGGDNFYLNLLGVATAAVLSVLTLRALKSTSYFYELAYIWDLKQELNLINRKHLKLKAAVAANDPDAITIMLYNLTGSRQLWLLDDNVLNLQELELELIQLEHQIKNLGLQISAEQYNRNLLQKF